jgi:hypothetical protein
MIDKVIFSVESGLIEDSYLAEPEGSGVRAAIWSAIGEVRPDLLPERVSRLQFEADPHAQVS